jgi:hypothetical protein
MGAAFERSICRQKPIRERLDLRQETAPTSAYIY